MSDLNIAFDRYASIGTGTAMHYILLLSVRCSQLILGSDIIFLLDCTPLLRGSVCMHRRRQSPGVPPPWIFTMISQRFEQARILLKHRNSYQLFDNDKRQGD